MGRTDVLVGAAQGWIDIAVVGFTPATIGVLSRAQPIDRLADIRLLWILASQGQTGQHAPRAVDVVAAPTAPPSAISLLARAQIVDAATNAAAILFSCEYTQAGNHTA